MKALMSNKLRQIIRDPEANQALEDGISKLRNHERSAEISVSGRKYEIEFIQTESGEKTEA